MTLSIYISIRLLGGCRGLITQGSHWCTNDNTHTHTHTLAGTHGSGGGTFGLKPGGYLTWDFDMHTKTNGHTHHHCQLTHRQALQFSIIISGMTSVKHRWEVHRCNWNLMLSLLTQSESERKAEWLFILCWPLRERRTEQSLKGSVWQTAAVRKRLRFIKKVQAGDAFWRHEAFICHEDLFFSVILLALSQAC